MKDQEMADDADVSAEVLGRDGLFRVRAMVGLAAERLTLLIQRAPDGAARLPGSEWTVRDLAAHVAIATEGYLGYLQGQTDSFVDMSDIAGGSLARTNAENLTEDTERNAGVLGSRLRTAAEQLLNATADRQGTDAVLWHGMTLDVGSVLAMTLGEYLMHGYDLARMLREPWPIGRDEARTVLASALQLLPLLGDPRTTAGVQAVFDLRVRGGTQVSLRIDNGRLTIEPPGGRVDCHVSAEPVALLLVAYGRREQWMPILTGRLFAWGRKPWLGPRLTTYLVAP